MTGAFNSFIDFGLMLFPDLDCVQSQVSTVCSTTSDPYIEIGDPDAVTKIEGIFGPSGTGTCGGTPTAAALSATNNYLGSLLGSAERYVLLATDGAPACNGNLDGSTCTCVSQDSCSTQPLNCLDDANTYAAATALSTAGFPVYVIGMGGATSWATQLGQIASAGGTNDYYPVENTSELVEVFESITTDAVSCRFNVDWLSLPGGTSNEHSKVNIYCKEAAGDTIDHGNVVGYDENCQSNKGWHWLDDDTIEFCTQACDSLKSADCAIIAATIGCDQVPVR
ncbi:MAG: hypothetical protein GY854_34090 [Deltaproteobacteria bacterium]|nr:hypothetical protein [Deltaproteobacteria bacterium]